MAERFSDNQTNLIVPKEVEMVFTQDHELKGSFYAKSSRVNGDAYMRRMGVGRNAYMERMNVGRDAYMRGMNVGRNAYMGGMRIGRDAYMGGMRIGRDACMNEMNVGGTLDMTGFKSKRLFLSTKQGIVIPKIILDEAEIEGFEEIGSILVREVSKKNAKLPNSLEEALERGMEVAGKSRSQTKTRKLRNPAG